MTDAKKNLIYRLGLIVLVVLAVYGNTLNHGFVWDDADVIVDNPQIRSLANVPAFFVSEDRIESATGYYRPMTYVSFALDHAVWGLNPVGYNITNLVLHCAVAMLLFFLISALFGSERLALVTALLFALHPLAGETVSFHAGGRNTLLCACFGVLALLFHIRKQPLPAVLCFTVAIFSKEFGLLLPIFMYAADRFIKSERRRPSSYALYLVPVACYFILRSYAVEKTNLLHAISFSGNLLLTPTLILSYLTHMFYPFNQKVLYDVHATISGAAAASVAIAGLMAMAWYFRKKPEIISSLCWFLIFLLPVANIILLPASSLMADRYGYISLMGFALFLAYVLCKTPVKISIPVVVIICSVYAAVAVTRNNYWRDDFSFNAQMIKDAPQMALGYHNQGIYYYKKGDMDNAEKFLLLANAQKDVTPRLLSGSSSVLWEASRLAAAEKVLLHQLELEPKNPQPYMMLKMIYARQGKSEQASSYDAKTSNLFPGIQEAMKKRAVDVCSQAEAFMTMRSFDKAENLLREALIIDPDFVPALVDMGNISAEKGESDKAVTYFTRAIALDPLNASAHYNLSQVYQAQGKMAEAEGEMKKYKEAEAKSKQKIEPSQMPPDASKQ